MVTKKQSSINFRSGADGAGVCLSCRQKWSNKVRTFFTILHIHHLKWVALSMAGESMVFKSLVYETMVLKRIVFLKYGMHKNSMQKYGKDEMQKYGMQG